MAASRAFAAVAGRAGPGLGQPARRGGVARRPRRRAAAQDRRRAPSSTGSSTRARTRARGSWPATGTRTGPRSRSWPTPAPGSWRSTPQPRLPPSWPPSCGRRCTARAPDCRHEGDRAPRHDREPRAPQPSRLAERAGRHGRLRRADHHPAAAGPPDAEVPGRRRVRRLAGAAAPGGHTRPRPAAARARRSSGWSPTAVVRRRRAQATAGRDRGRRLGTVPAAGRWCSGLVLAWISPELVHATRDEVWVVRAAASLLVLNVALMGIAGLPQSVLRARTWATGGSACPRRSSSSARSRGVHAVAGWGLVGLAAAAPSPPCCPG